ncbi:MAG: hypothetical protein LKF69_02895 [Bacilli bacterium]|jgi:hypothetical protein|nr:hypothetical protein [Bacilli bacterium]MCH4201585.1 hypothetical protein [Bacilli bacterium]MCH4235729.1 hypothetical protein [Bacilli bacterium]
MSYYLLYVISENTDNMHAMLKELSQAGFNGTIIPTASLRHAITCDTYIGDMPMFGNLNDVVHDKYQSNTTLYIVVKGSDLERAKSIVRDVTQNFTLTKGGMFDVELHGYEGSF